MHKGLIEQIKKMMDAQKQLSKASSDVIKNEPHMYDKLLSEEKNMAEEDMIPFTVEEMENNVMRQMENNPFRLALNRAREKLEEAAKHG